MGREHGDPHWFLQALLLAQKGEFVPLTSGIVMSVHVAHSFQCLKGKFFSGCLKRKLTLLSPTLVACHCPARIVLFPGYRLVFFNVISFIAQELSCISSCWGVMTTRITRVVLSDWGNDPSADGCLTKHWLILQDLIRGKLICVRFHLWLRNLIVFLINRIFSLECNLCCHEL